MLRLSLPAIHDVARFAIDDSRRSLSSTEILPRLKEYFDEGPRGFNYQPARRIGTTFLKGGLKPEIAVAGCHKIGSPSGRKVNAEVVELLCEWAQGREFSFYDVPTQSLSIRPDQSIRVPIEGYLVEGGVPSFFWMQPRKGANPNQPQLSLIATCIKHVYGVDDFRDVGLIVLDFSAPGRGERRVLSVYGYDDLTLFSRAQLQTHLTEFFAAFQTLVNSGYRRPDRPSKEKHQDDRQIDLLD